MEATTRRFRDEPQWRTVVVSRGKTDRTRDLEVYSTRRWQHRRNESWRATWSGEEKEESTRQRMDDGWRTSLSR